MCMLNILLFLHTSVLFALRQLILAFREDANGLFSETNARNLYYPLMENVPIFHKLHSIVSLVHDPSSL